MARLAASIACGFHRLEVHTRVRAARKSPHIVRMALVAGRVAHESRAFNFRRRDHAALKGRAGRKEKTDTRKRAEKRYRKEPLHPLTHLNYNPARRWRELLRAEGDKLDEN
jgi:hypothetical protein